MKIKLLRKVRRKVMMYERNGLYYVDTGHYMDYSGMTQKQALLYYRVWVIRTAKRIFSFRPKQQFFY